MLLARKSVEFSGANSVMDFESAGKVKGDSSIILLFLATKEFQREAVFTKGFFGFSRPKSASAILCGLAKNRCVVLKEGSSFSCESFIVKSLMEGFFLRN